MANKEIRELKVKLRAAVELRVGENVSLITCPVCNGVGCSDDSNVTEYGFGYMECETCNAMGFLLEDADGNLYNWLDEPVTITEEVGDEAE